MLVDKSDILDLLDALGRREAVEQARQELPDQVDLERDDEALRRYGLDADNLQKGLAGPGDLGGEGGLLEGQGI